ncbi:MAG: NADH-quinone oxidoreductase subunit N, partial [Candidatus Heimdallarchaeota archaeon]|nr:NADH-quinone oxidoreductase subunit N [Candidatus Heimdallarchaeota archaeon]
MTWLPVSVLFLGIILILVVDLIFREKAKVYTVILSVLTLSFSSLMVIQTKGTNAGSMFFFGDFYVFFSIVGLLSSIIVVFSAWKDYSVELDLGVFFSLLLLANAGGILIAASRNFIPLYLGYELVSIPTYAMIAFKKKNRSSAESGLKIFLLGALSSAIIIYGLAMYYGATGTLQMGGDIINHSKTLAIAALVLITVGSSFKIGLVPFHYWIADVYSGASVSVVNFLSASSKKMAFAFVFQIFFVGMSSWHNSYTYLFAILATFSVIVGNIVAVVQDRLLRIIAYSTIAQAGYIVMGIVAYGEGNTFTKELAMKGILFHITAHVLMKGAAIAAILVVISSTKSDHINNFRGLFHTSPITASALAIAFFSLMGIPPAAGFYGKFFLFLSLVEAGYEWLALIGIIG